MAIFNNSATLSYNGVVTTSNVTTGEILELLTVTKTAVTGSYRAGERITYVISMTNTGAAALTGLTLTDDLGAYSFGTETLVPLTYTENSARYYVNGVLQPAPDVVPGPPLQITGLSVPAGGNVILVYEAAANSYAPLDQEDSIVNSVTVEGDGACTATAQETVSPAQGPQLTVSKSLCPTTVTCAGQINYTFVIQNSGNTPATAEDDVILSDLFDPVLELQSVTFDGTPWGAPDNYTYDAQTGLFSTVSGQITVPAATFTQDPVSGSWAVNPGTAVLIITGTLA